MSGASQEISNVFWNQTASTVHGFTGAILSLSGYSDPGNGILGNFSGLSSSHSGDITYIGSISQDSLNLGANRSQFTGNLDISLGDGNDSVRNGAFKNGDSLDAGAGDDTIAIMATGSDGIAAFSSLNMAKLDGGSGTDTLDFFNSTTGGAEVNLTRGGAVNFEN